MSRLSREGWLETHPYLRGVGDFCAQVDRALAQAVGESPVVPSFDDHRDEFVAGVPLLQGQTVPIDLEPAGRVVVALVQRLAADASVGAPAAEVAALDLELRGQEGASERIAGWLLGDDSWMPSTPGLLRFLGWTAMRRHLAPVVDAFARWRDEERWLRGHCPTCGSGPAMAQLVGKDPGRKRFLACGRCGTRWQYKRTQCPYCEADVQRASALSIAGEAGLRVDHCEACRGYLKTYDGEGDEALLLTDWSSLHLDLLAMDRGFKRLAGSLYELPPAPASAETG